MTQLQRITNINSFISVDGKSICCFYNCKGALLSKEGVPVSDLLKKMPVFVLNDDFTKYIHFDVTKDSSCDTSWETNEDDRPAIIKELTKQFGSEVVDIFHYAVSEMRYIMSTKGLTSDIMNRAMDLINSTVNSDRTAISVCLNFLRDVDQYTYDHSLSVYLMFIEAVSDFKQGINDPRFFGSFKEKSSKVNFNRDSVKNYAMGALLHDYGKVFLPESILNKPGKLTTEEFEIMKTHPAMGVKELSRFGLGDFSVLRIVGDHHAHYRHYNNESHNPLAQICNILDIYDACRSKRPYKEPFSFQKTIDFLKEDKIQYKWDDYIFENLINFTLPKFEQKVMATGIV